MRVEKKIRAAIACAAILAFAPALSSCREEPADFSGYWNAADMEGAYFGLNLSQEGKALSGYHDGGLNDASRIDSSSEADGISVRGTVEGKTATLTIESHYSEGVTYGATLTMLDDGRARWKVTKRMDGQTYIPGEALMEQDAGIGDEGDADGAGGDETTGAAFIRDGQVLMDFVDLQIEGISPSVMELTEQSTEGGQASFWRDDEGIPMKLAVEYFGETGKAIREYFYSDGTLAVARLTSVNYEGGMMADGGPSGSAETTTVYLDYGEIALIIAPDGTELSAGSDEWSRAAEIVQSEPGEFANLGGMQ